MEGGGKERGWTKFIHAMHDFFIMIVTFARVEFISHEPLYSDIKLSKIECLYTLILARDYFDAKNLNTLF